MNNQNPKNIFIVVILLILISFLLFICLKAGKVKADEVHEPQITLQSLAEEIKVSREREDLLLQHIKLIDYQISVLTEKVMQ